MLQITPHMRIFVATQPVDFRRGIDGLARECRKVLGENPMSGAVFVFRNRKRTSIKLLNYDGQGFWLCQKRLSASKFCYWPKADDEKAARLLSHELAVLLRAGDPHATKAAPDWKHVA